MTTPTQLGSTFQVLEVSIALIRALRGSLVQIRRRNPRLARQVEDAAASIAANIAEGNRRRGKDRTHFFLIAAGSADETRTHLRVADAFGYLAERDTAEALALLDRILAMLWKLTR